MRYGAVNMHRKTIGGRTYIYESVRKGRKVTSVCKGRADGLFGDLLDLMNEDDASRKQEAREAKRQAEADARADDAVAGKPIDLMGRMANWMMRDLGFHRSDRGKWRRVRMTTKRKAISTSKSTTPAKAGHWSKAKPGTLTWDQAETMAELRKGGDPAVVDRVNALLDLAIESDEGATRDVMRVYTCDRPGFRAMLDSVANHPRKIMLAKAFPEGSPNGPLARDLLSDECRQMVERLAGDKPSEVERLLAERAATAWLDAYTADVNDAASLNTGKTIDQGVLSDRRRNSAHKRYVSTLRALAAVRRVSLTVSQTTTRYEDAAAPSQRVTATVKGERSGLPSE